MPRATAPSTSTSRWVSDSTVCWLTADTDTGHPDVHQDDVGQLAQRDGDRLRAVRRLAHNLDVVGRPQQHTEPAAHEHLVIGDRDADHDRCPPYGRCAVTRKPPPG